MMHQVVECDCCGNAARDPKGWMVLRYNNGHAWGTMGSSAFLQIEEVKQFSEQQSNMHTEHLCSLRCVLRAVKRILEAKPKA